MPLFSLNPIMTTKKAIIIGTLCALGVALTAYAIKKGINVKPKTITEANADNFNNKKNRIITDSLNDGWQFEVDAATSDNGNTAYWTTPNTYTYTETTQPTNYENTSWTFKPTIFVNGGIDLDINFQSGGTNYIAMLDDGETLAWFEEIDQDYNNPIIVYRDNYGWTDSSYRYITITENTNATTFKNWLWNNTERTTETFLGNKRHETKTTTYLSTEYIMLSQKTFTYTSVKSETLFFIKLQSTGYTRQLYLEHAVIYTAIPNMIFNNTYPTYNAQFKMSKMTSMNIAESTTIQQQKGSFLNKYNSIQNKTNIYSVDAYVSGTTMNQQQNITYTNETGTSGTATFGHAIAAENNTSYWRISQNTPDVDIYTQGRANYVVIYTSCEVSNFQQFTQQEHEQWYRYLYQCVGVNTQFDGYGISSNPVTPPDIENGNFMSLTEFILNILTLPFTFLSQAFDLTLWANTPWAFNIKNAIFVMIGIMTFLFIIKLFTRGFDSLGNYTGSISKNKANRSQAKLNKEKAKLAKRTDPNTKTRINKKE